MCCRLVSQPALESHVGEYGFNGRPPLSSSEKVEILEAANAYASEKYPDLKSATFMFQQENHEKRFATSNGSEGLSTINRAAFYIILTAEDQNGRPVELMKAMSGKGSLAALQLSTGKIEPVIDYRELCRNAAIASWSNVVLGYIFCSINSP